MALMSLSLVESAAPYLARYITLLEVRWRIAESGCRLCRLAAMRRDNTLQLAIAIALIVVALLIVATVVGVELLRSATIRFIEVTLAEYRLRHDDTRQQRAHVRPIRWISKDDTHHGDVIDRIEADLTLE